MLIGMATTHAKPVRIHPAIAWGTSYLRRFLRGECPAWEEALNQQGMINRKALQDLSWLSLSDTACATLMELIWSTGYCTPGQLAINIQKTRFRSILKRVS